MNTNSQNIGVRNFRSIVLLGPNVATYKFALGKTLLSLAEEEKTFVSMEDLALPFALHVVEHIKKSDRQATSRSSRFLDACRSFARGEIDEDELRAKAVSLGFVNVIDAFHNVNRAPVPTRFYIDARREHGGIKLTDDLLAMAQTADFPNLETEVEARWRLVETAWGLEIPVQRIGAEYDSLREEIVVTDRSELHRQGRRVGVTKFRYALNGYQRGRCFYCAFPVSITTGHVELADVDHYFPRKLMLALPEIFHSRIDGAVSMRSTAQSSVNIDGIWNLVLSCKECNRGAGGKFTRVPHRDYLERIFERNEYLIKSHLPLRETLLRQTGHTPGSRRAFLDWMDRNAVATMLHRWRPSKS